MVRKKVPHVTRHPPVSLPKTLGAVSAIGALVARRWQLVHVIVGDDAGRGGGLCQLHSQTGKTTNDSKAIRALSEVC